MQAKQCFVELRCKECGRAYPKEAIHVCELDFGPLEAVYDYQAIRSCLSRRSLAARPPSMWKYREFLPLEGDPVVGLHVGFTPLVRARRLGEALGIRELYIKNDTVNHPTLSFKDRVVAVALSRAKELGLSTVACASTGNLANSLAANAASAGFQSYVLIPADLERSKVMSSLIYGARVIGIRGPYDQVNRLCSEIAGKYSWGFVNINLRPYYAEGSKTMGFEIVEQLGWSLPTHTVIPMASGSLLTKIAKAYRELVQTGLVEEKRFAVHGAQAAGCSPITEAFRRGSDLIRPVPQPSTIAKSLAIGSPADGYYAVRTIRETGGAAEAASDEEILHGIELLAETEGIFAETAGGVTVACAQKLAKAGRLSGPGPVVLCITAHGLKTPDALEPRLPEPPVIAPSLREFDALVAVDGEALWT
ncbi:threonine synthase [Candidatus Methylacidithermus pantelleriae]|uniref:Threonine synthase n=1 Tax=Candidatus Methylacidithermus pantelleriae TaxID=2744239 RepID=A0A8J2FSY1_9BACT|nr:threonine synthase [Candidatus Methylacidithermus pantelleriae]CAF0699178.1 Threonine synthase [Candidatus Methylacidithermus pantelleriae]